MTRTWRALALLASLATGCAAAPPGDRVQPAEPESNDRHILVMVADPDIDRLDLRGARSGAYRMPRRYPSLPSAIARAMAGLAAEHRLRRVDQWPMLSLGAHCVVYEAPPDADIDALIARLAADRRVESVQRMNRFELQASPDARPADDPYRRLQRSLDELEVTEAHR